MLLHNISCRNIISTSPNYSDLIQLRLATSFCNSSLYNVPPTLNLYMTGYPLFPPSVIKGVIQLQYALDVNKELRRQITYTNVRTPLQSNAELHFLTISYPSFFHSTHQSILLLLSSINSHLL
jgi:hypothetical protein